MVRFLGKGKAKAAEKEAVAAAATATAGADGASAEAIDVDEVMRKYDKESNTRIWEGIPKIVVTACMVAFSVYCLLMTLLSTEQAEARLARFLAFVILIGYMMYPSRKKEHRVNHIPWYDVVLALAGFGAFMYFAVNCTEILLMGARIEPLHVALGIVGIVLSAMAMKRCPSAKGLAIGGLVCAIVGTVLNVSLVACALCVVGSVLSAAAVA